MRASIAGDDAAVADPAKRPSEGDLAHRIVAEAISNHPPSTAGGFIHGATAIG